MYRKILLASVGAIALTGSAALAADLPSRAPPPAYLPPVPIFTWTGIYLGGQIGYAWGNDGISASFLGIQIPSANYSPQGVIGGAHVGYNYQINQWVIGLEGTVDGTSLDRTSVQPITGLAYTTRSDVQGSIRGRVGIAWDRALIYGTGGVAFAGVNNNSSFAPLGLTDGFSTTRVGWTVGGGIEYAVTNNWSVRSEYRYSDFGSYTHVGVFGAAVPPGINVRHHLTENQVQVGFSYKFDMFAPYPVVAKY